MSVPPVKESDPKTEAQKIRLRYLPLQLLLVGSWIYQELDTMSASHARAPLAINILGALGAGLFTYCLLQLYAFPKKTKTLITTGPFRYTRHPMYTGALLIGLHVWWPVTSELSFPYFLSLTIFVLSVLLAGYLQEKEVLLQFGLSAHEYYRRTPRIFLFYPYYWWRNRKQNDSSP